MRAGVPSAQRRADTRSSVSGLASGVLHTDARPRLGAGVRRVLGTGRAWHACVGERMTWQERRRTIRLKARPAFRTLCFEVRGTCAT